MVVTLRSCDLHTPVTSLCEAGKAQCPVSDQLPVPLCPPAPRLVSLCLEKEYNFIGGRLSVLLSSSPRTTVLPHTHTPVRSPDVIFYLMLPLIFVTYLHALLSRSLVVCFFCFLILILFLSCLRRWWRRGPLF